MRTLRALRLHLGSYAHAPAWTRRAACLSARTFVRRGVCRIHAHTAACASLVGALTAVSTAHIARANSPYATNVVSFTQGTGAVAGFNNPLVALGAPERFTGEGLFPQAVTPFQPAYRPNEVVSLGVGGSLVLAFDRDVIDDPRNPFGVDLIVFGNSFFTDASFGFGVVAGLASEGGTISVSHDGVEWFVAKVFAADGLFPTLGYLDIGPFSTVPGIVESNFQRPIDPTVTLEDCLGLSYEDLLAVYDGSGGGTGIDIGALGLDRVRYVRIDGPMSPGFSPEIDAIAIVAPVGIPADLDGNGTVGAPDLAMLLGLWGSASSTADLDGNGTVGASDLAMLLASWGGGSGT
jgi:hypothetical protein